MSTATHELQATPELTVVYEKDGGRWWKAQIAEVPGAESHGRTKREAKESAMVALALVLQVRRDGYFETHECEDCETLKVAA